MGCIVLNFSAVSAGWDLGTDGEKENVVTQVVQKQSVGIIGWCATSD